MTLNEIIKGRYSVRKYSSTPVEEEKITAVLQAGRLAPTAKNSQPQLIYRLKTQEAKEKIKGLTACHFNAPEIFIMCGNKERECISTLSRHSFMETDVAIVQTHMMLKAHELGLGTCWVGRINPPEVHKAYNLPDNVVVYGLLVMGYPADDSEPNPRHNERIEIDEFYKEL
ncbi:MAG: nitroreductase family protein [Clostridia bacterium]|nr:nitroreductase family protein [Clostridia bacterium]